MESSKHTHKEESTCNCLQSGNAVRQTLEELDFERGIWYAAQSNDLERVRMLLKKGTSSNEVDAAGYTALHYAARNGHKKICEELLSHGANVNALTKSGKATALHRAATQNHDNIVDLLLKSNADANLQDSDGFTALHRAIMSNSEAASKLLIPKTNLSLVDKSGYNPKEIADKMGKNWF